MGPGESQVDFALTKGKNYEHIAQSPLNSSYFVEEEAYSNQVTERTVSVYVLLASIMQHRIL